jgi:DNA-binding beta-propeller fold protein YncE
MRTFISAAVLCYLTAMQGASPGPLTFVRSIELPAVQGRIDHLALDASGEKLFVAALGNNTVEVLDVKNGAHVKSLSGFREPQGIGFADDAKQIAIANGQGDGLQFVDAGDYHLGKTVALGDDSDNVRYDATAKRLYVGYGSGALAAVDPSDGRVLGQVKLPGHPESFQLEHNGSRIFVNVPSAEQLVVVDRSALKVIATWPVTAARANYPMALDETNHRLFIGCRRPAKVLVYDISTGKRTGASDIVGDTDDMFFDAKRSRLYVAGGEGFIDVLDVRATGTITRLAHMATSAGARTALLGADQGRLYLAVPHRGSQRAEIRVYEARD